MSNDQRSSKRKPKFNIESVRVTDQDQASVRRVLGRLTGKVPFPDEDKVPSPESTTENIGNTDLSGSTDLNDNTDKSGTTALSDTIKVNGSTNKSSTTNLSGITSLTGITKKISSTTKTGGSKRDDTAKSIVAPQSRSAVSPERDFQKVPNSVTREAMSARLFRGKSKQVWDFLWSQSRGAIVPSRTVRRSRPEIKMGAGLGSMGTVDAAIEHLQTVRLIAVKTIVGESGGNEYEVFTPEEAAAGIFSSPNLPSTTNQTSSTGSTQNSVLPVVPESGITSSTSNVVDSAISEEAKTSFKTKEEKTDDEAFAGLLALLKQAAKDVTGKETTVVERERWNEVAELLITELKLAAARTTVSSAPAFLTEHLRRRLSRQPPPQPVTRVSATPPVAAPLATPPSDDELIDMFTGFLHEGMTVEDLDGQLSASIDSQRWPRIRQAALGRYEREREQMRPPDRH